MTRKRRLSMESLEPRIVLDGFGLQPPPSPAEWVSVIVTLQDNAEDPEGVGHGITNAHGGRLGHVYQHALKGFSAKLPAAALAALEKNPWVKHIDEDRLVQAAMAQTVPTGIDRINAEPQTGDVVTVDVDIAIIDTGIDASHDDLNVVGGRHFYTVTTGRPSQRGPNVDDNYDDDGGHGSHVAGIAAARNNDLGVVGVAPGARLWAVKVLDANGAGYESDIVAGVDWVTERADIIEVANMSLGWQGVNNALHQAIQNSVAAGVVYVVASGNDYAEILGDDNEFGNSNDFIPAAYPEVATISAIADTDGMPGGFGPLTEYADYFGSYEDDTFADFSNFSNSPDAENSWYIANNPVTSPGLGIDLMLPGVDIYSTYKSNGYATMSGTSMAAPHAAGLAALYIVENGRAHNAGEVYAIRQALIDGGKGWRSPEGLQFPNTGGNSDSPDKHEENLGWGGASGPANETPVANDDSATTDEDTAVGIDVLADDSDPDGDPLTVDAFTQGANGTVADTDGGILTYTPSANFNGSDSFTYSISDGSGGTDSATVNITVNAINDASVTLDDSYSVQENEILSVPAPAVLGNDTDVDGDSLFAVLVTDVASGSLTLKADGSFTYTPNTDFVGTDSFTYKANDGTADSNTATVTITVNEFNSTPVAGDDSSTTDEDTAVTVDVLANDSDLDGDPLTVATVTQGTHGTVVNNDSNVTYTPDTDFFGTDTFTYTVSDGKGGADVATVNVSVTSVNDDPVAVDDSATTDEDVAATIDVLANDSDVDGNPLSVTAVGTPSHGTAVVNPDYTITYTPNAGFSGTDSFTYTMVDGNGGTAEGTVSIEVEAAQQRRRTLHLRHPFCAA